MNHLTGWLNSLLFDRLGHGSRPKLLFAVALADVLSVVGAWPLASLLIGSPSTPSMVGRRRNALFDDRVTASRPSWSYSIPSLRRVALRTLKAPKSVVAVASIAAGLAEMSDQRIGRPRKSRDG